MDPPSGHSGLVVSVFDCGPTGRRFESASCRSTLTYLSVAQDQAQDWVNKGLVCATGHIKDPVPFLEKSRASCPGGRFPPGFIK